MDKFETFSGVVAPLDKNNIDTDAIIPKQYLKSISNFLRVKKVDKAKIVLKVEE